MNKPTFDAMMVQYKKPTIEGEGAVSWDKGVRCVMPEVIVGGKAEQTQYSGKNLFDKNNPDQTQKLYIEAGVVISSSITTVVVVPCLPNTVYTISKMITSRFRVFVSSEYPLLGVLVTPRYQQSADVTAVTVTTLDTSAYLLVIIHNQNFDTATPLEDVLNTVQIEEGTTATACEPYTGGIPAPNPTYPIEPVFSERTEVVSRGKNLFDVSKVTPLPNGRIQNNGDGSITVTGYSTSPGVGSQNKLHDLATGLTVGKTYTLNAATTCTEQTQIYLLEAKVRWSFGTSLLVTEDILASTVVLYADGKGETDSIWDIQIEEGPTTTPYVPYFDGGTAVAPELLAIPGTEYRDEWNPQTGKGVRRVERVVLDGTEAWDFSYLEQYQCVLFPVSPRVDPQSVAICSHGGKISPGNSVGTDVQFGGFGTSFIDYWGIDNEADWRAYLAAQYAAGTPVTVWYALKEPIEFQTAPQPLIAPKGTGHIMQVGGNLDGCPITAKYVTHS